MEFSWHADGNGLQIVIQNVDLCVRNRSSDRNSSLYEMRVADPIYRANGSFGWPIKVMQRGRRKRQETLSGLDRKRLSTTDHASQRRNFSEPLFIENDRKH